MKLVEPGTAGCPVSGERWVRTSLRGLATALGHRAGPTTLGRLRRANGLGLRGHRKRLTRHETCPQWNDTTHPRTGGKNTE